RTRSAELDERAKRLQRTEARIGGLIQFISDGDQSPYVRTTLLDLEAQAKAEKAAIAAIQREATQPIHLPSPGELEALALDVSARVAQDPLAGREVLKRLLKDGRIVLEPQPDGVYLARTAVLPLVLLAERDLRNPGEFPGAALSRLCSGGALLAFVSTPGVRHCRVSLDENLEPLKAAR